MSEIRGQEPGARGRMSEVGCQETAASHRPIGSPASQGWKPAGSQLEKHEFEGASPWIIKLFRHHGSQSLCLMIRNFRGQACFCHFLNLFIYPGH